MGDADSAPIRYTALSPQNQDLYALPLRSSGGNDRRYECARPKHHKKLNNFHFRGTALGGWLVLEPWITPSLFYQFLGATKKWGKHAKDHVALDSYTFCTALGKEEANRQLRQHWKTWVTEDVIRELAGTVDTVRIPVADWMFVPYEPYIGCWDGAIEELDRVLKLCQKMGIKAMLDVHTAPGSQNGLDNSGTTGSYEWYMGPAPSPTISQNQEESHLVLRYQHWQMRGGDWVGDFNLTSGRYSNINNNHVLHQLQVVEKIVAMYRDNSVVVAITPVNEPWENCPMDVMLEFYWRVYQLVQREAPHWISVFHDVFHLYDMNLWKHFLVNCDNYALDTHTYQAWDPPSPLSWSVQQTCQKGSYYKQLEENNIPIIVGEWSLATDNCAMWLNGFNDNVPGFPNAQCERVRCPQPYLNEISRNLTIIYEQPGAPPDPSQPAMDPFGAGGMSHVEYGMCPIDALRDNSDLRKMAAAKLLAFDSHTHGQFFWNFRTELEPKWDYQQAVNNDWIPTDWGNSSVLLEIQHSCDVDVPRSLTADMVLLVGVLILVICMTALYMAFKYCSGRLSYDNGDSGDLDEQSLLIAQSIDVETQRQTDSYYQSQD